MLGDQRTPLLRGGLVDINVEVDPPGVCWVQAVGCRDAFRRSTGTARISSGQEVSERISPTGGGIGLL